MTKHYRQRFVAVIALGEENAVKDCYLDRIPGAKDTDFLPQQITSRYNVIITAVPVSP